MPYDKKALYKWAPYSYEDDWMCVRCHMVRERDVKNKESDRDPSVSPNSR